LIIELNEIALNLDQPIMHIRGTRLAVHSRRQITVTNIGESQKALPGEHGEHDDEV
jgi:hypothetical protein